MMTLRQFGKTVSVIPTATVWLLGDLAEARGKQELYTRQSPQMLKALREHALSESTIASNRIEGITIDQARVPTVLSGNKSILRDRNEKEVRGYRNALKLIHEQTAGLQISEETILRLHALCRPEIWDSGRYKQKDVDIVETYSDGPMRIRFKSVAASKTPDAVRELVSLWHDRILDRRVPPLVLMAAFNLDFLCIHPFRDGNGRVSRLLLLLQCYQLGLEVGRYISLERLIEENKDRYYETLEQSSHGWHQGRHDPWPYINYLLFILERAFREFEQRVGETKQPKGAKAEIVLHAICNQSGEFRLADIERACPGVGREWIRTLLADLKEKGEVSCHGKGPAARWRYLTSKGTTLK